MKKNGGTIDNWQVHNLSMSQESIDTVYPGENLKPMVFTGTVIGDTDRWRDGHHMRSSLIVKIDRESGIIETRNTIYKVLNEGGDSVSDTMAVLTGKESSDLGDGALGIFY